MINYREPDLTQHPPRSPRVRLGGFAHLPRLLDKARAVAAGKNGPYVWAAMMDRHFFDFTGIDAQALLDVVKTGKPDGEMLSWVMEHLSPKRSRSEILQWSNWLEALGPGDAEGHAWLAGRIASYGPNRDDVRTYCEHLDLDDYTSFGGVG
jgi:Domain of unknown function (DUF5069)